MFVGKHLVERLLDAGRDVAVLNRGRTPSTLPADVERLVADRTDVDQMRAALAGRDWDAVFDVSGFVMAAGGSDIDGLLDLLDGHAGAYVYTSSIMAYDQSWVGVFPWTEEQPTNPDGPASYGGFKALAEASILARHARTGFPGSIVRPAAIYGPDNNIFDMELPMFLRLLQQRPILVPHGGLVVGSYGHVDDLCAAMIAMATTPAAAGEVFNVSTDSVDVNRYIAVLARRGGSRAGGRARARRAVARARPDPARRRRSGTCSRSATTRSLEHQQGRADCCGVDRVRPAQRARAHLRVVPRHRATTGSSGRSSIRCGRRRGTSKSRPRSRSGSRRG